MAASPRATPNALRAVGAVAMLAWVGLALLHGDAWSGAGALALGAALAASVALRPATSLVPRTLLAPPRAVFVGACALAAAGVSWWVTQRTLRGEPLSIDSGIYLFQARAMAHGHFGSPAPLPAQAFGDRFELEGPDGRLYGIFPPGWPLALVPLVWLGRPMLAGPLLAAALVVAQAWLGRAIARGDAKGDDARSRAPGSEPPEGELATRLSLLLSLPSIGRALETADLLSHAFAAVLACVAIAAALDVDVRPRALSAAVGACVGWVLASRLLDGVVLAAVAVGALATTRTGRRSAGWVALGAAPFVALLLLEQRAATGAWVTPTQTAYFQRTDWPPTCHRLGFGPDIGCTVEHPGPVSRLGGHGFGPAQSLDVARERMGALGEDLFGFAPLALLAFVPCLVGAGAGELVALAFVLALTLAYGFYYYGNALFFGSRHLFPTAPFFWLLVARGCVRVPHRGAGWLAGPHARGAAATTVLVVALVAARGPWRTRLADAAAFQANRSDLRRTMDVHDIARGILKTRDYTALAAAYDGWDQVAPRLYVLEDGSGLMDLRRAYPALPVFLSLPEEGVGRLYVTAPAPGMLVELERAWPSFVRPVGLASRQSPQEGASGGSVLLVSHAAEGATLRVPFDVVADGAYALRLDGFAGPDGGDYAIDLDGEPLAVWRGYAPAPAPSKTEPARRSVARGRHALVARCTGHDAASAGFDARFDAFVGEPMPAGP